MFNSEMLQKCVVALIQVNVYGSFLSSIKSIVFSKSFMYCISLNKSPGVYFLPSIKDPAFKQGRLLIKTRCVFPTFLIDIIIIGKYHAYKTIWTLFVIELNSLSAASSYQEWFQVKAWASK